ncbi:hypothetical protein [Kibdelosporangium aridum]|uniref:Uncharacterized protein n=1 Tax=Kibdelosporangium aridum TaxID=2030 RepID=A0A1Y5XVG8_KIBAR|nr:hypothetical protein [Kibdelosporangium aridum]SMD16081.1 hypothetical protein SAMN05661093_05402 [Kibdelosporangium aridum]
MEPEEETRRVPLDRWCVLIEETVGHSSYLRWELTRIKSFGSRADALAEAANLAKGYEPQHPGKGRSRRIFRTGEDLWTVQVRGAKDETSHFRVVVAKPETP